MFLVAFPPVQALTVTWSGLHEGLQASGKSLSTTPHSLSHEAQGYYLSYSSSPASPDGRKSFCYMGKVVGMKMSPIRDILSPVGGAVLAGFRRCDLTLGHKSLGDRLEIS